METLELIITVILGALMVIFVPVAIVAKIHTRRRIKEFLEERESDK